MKCPKCNGRGTVGYYDVDHFLDVECDRCNGSGEVEMTNEEWIKQCNTEQLAEWLRGVYWHCHEIDCEHCNYPWRCMEKGDIVEWLKQPHREE